MDLQIITIVVCVVLLIVVIILRVRVKAPKQEPVTQQMSFRKYDVAMNQQICYDLPYELSVFKSWGGVVCFWLYFILFGWWILILRLFLLIVLSMWMMCTGTVPYSWMMRFVSGDIIKFNNTIPGEMDKEPDMFIVTHNKTLDLFVVQFLKPTALIVSSKIYGSAVGRLFRHIMMRMRGTFHDTIREWDTSKEKTRSLTVAYAGMTQKSEYMLPCHNFYFEKRSKQPKFVMLESTNVFGAANRSIDASLSTNMLIQLSILSTEKVNIYRWDFEDNDDLADFAMIHGKTFAYGWTQRARRNISKYLKNSEMFERIDGDYLSHHVPQDVFVTSKKELPQSVKSLIDRRKRHCDFTGDDDTMIITDYIIGNPYLGIKSRVAPRNILLVNPIDERDVCVAAAFGVQIYYEDKVPMEVKVNEIVQHYLDYRVIQWFSKLLHFMLLEKYLIVIIFISVLMPGEYGMYALQFLRYLATVHIPLISLKVFFKRPRPLWLSGTSLMPQYTTTQMDYAFPSGHTAFMVYIATFMYLVWGNIVGTVVMSVVAGITALDRVRLGVHYLTDVLFALVYGVLSMWFVDTYLYKGIEWFLVPFGIALIAKYAAPSVSNVKLEYWKRTVVKKSQDIKYESLYMNKKQFEAVAPLIGVLLAMNTLDIDFEVSRPFNAIHFVSSLLLFVVVVIVGQRGGALVTIGAFCGLLAYMLLLN